MLHPIKQGLKPLKRLRAMREMAVAMLHPIKQGLKRPGVDGGGFCLWVAMLHPIKQGLKLRNPSTRLTSEKCCYATSNKTRIETSVLPL